jgi:hypothetical protein
MKKLGEPSGSRSGVDVLADPVGARQPFSSSLRICLSVSRFSAGRKALLLNSARMPKAP